MNHNILFYMDGEWRKPLTSRSRQVCNPATEEVFAEVSLGTSDDADGAVAAARAALPAYSSTTREERIALLERIAVGFKARQSDLAVTLGSELGAPQWLAERAHVGMGLAHIAETLAVLRDYPFTERLGKALVEREPVGVCALITPWNWPVNQIMCKVLPALAAGCTMVLKPSEIAPLNAIVLAEIFDEAGIPPGVFNLLNGNGDEVGNHLARHPGIDMVSFTGSTRAGIAVAKAAADTVKRVQQELGGKSPCIVLREADLRKAVTDVTRNCFINSGQTCNAPTRLLVDRSRHAEAVELAREATAAIRVGDPGVKGTTIGPVVSAAQFERVQRYIGLGVSEGATLVAGGPGRPDGLAKGWYVKPTVFADVEPGMTIAREEIFGPVLSIMPYDHEDDAVRIANDTPYGLAGYVYGASADEAYAVGRQLRVGTVHLNGAAPNFSAPFGGYKQSGNGREWGRFGIDEMTEVKSVLGAPA